MPPASSLSHSRPILRCIQSTPSTTRCASSAQSKQPSDGIKSKLAPVKYPPEHPKFIYVPQPPQKQATVRLVQKGVLPRPRKIFDSARVNKVSPEYLNAATPKPAKVRSTSHVTPPEKEYIDYKTRQSALRRKNFREGLIALRERKTKVDEGVATRSAQRQRDYERRVSAPEREDEYLTKPTILQALLPGRNHIQPDPSLSQTLVEKKARHEQSLQAKMDERRSALHTLYVNAKDFIVTQDDLNKKIEAEFEQPAYKNNPGRGVFDIEGIPHTASGLLDGKAGSWGLIDRKTRQGNITNDRIKRIAEELTGGKIEARETSTGQ